MVGWTEEWIRLQIKNVDSYWGEEEFVVKVHFVVSPILIAKPTNAFGGASAQKYNRYFLSW